MFHQVLLIILNHGGEGDWDIRISDLVKNLTELIFNPCDEFRLSPVGSISHIHSPYIHGGAPGIFSDILRSVQIVKRVGCRKQREATAPTHP